MFQVNPWSNSTVPSVVTCTIPSRLVTIISMECTLGQGFHTCCLWSGQNSAHPRQPISLFPGWLKCGVVREVWCHSLLVPVFLLGCMDSRFMLWPTSYRFKQLPKAGRPPLHVLVHRSNHSNDHWCLPSWPHCGNTTHTSYVLSYTVMRQNFVAVKIA